MSGLFHHGCNAGEQGERRERAGEGWKWQIASRIQTREQLEKFIALTDTERAALNADLSFPFAVTPYYAGLLKHEPLRRTIIPSVTEASPATDEWNDPLGEEDHRVTPHLIHTYPDKVLFLVTSFCPAYCRYCTRSRLMEKGDVHAGSINSSAAEPESPDALDQTFRYIESHTEIRDVLISGGDPLALTDPVLDRLLSRIRAIPHIRMVRIGSKIPAVLPMRITDPLCAILRKHRVWLSLHFIHAAELTAEARDACRKLSDHGISMVSQTVLLKNINDDVQTLTDLFYGLLEINVKPYYLLQCDPVRGSARFRTPVEKGIELIQSLHGRISGLAVPQYVIDAPGGGGKVPLLSSGQIRRDGDDAVFTNYQGREYRYPDPLP